MTEAEIEALAVKHEAFGFGRVDAKGYTTHGFDPDGLAAFVRAVAEEAVRLERERMEVLHRMKYHPNIDGEGDWELFPIDTDECKECFEVLIVRSPSS